MWFDESGFKHNGPTPYNQRKLAELRASMTVEEKYKEKVEDACRWLNILLYSDTDAGIGFIFEDECLYELAPNKFDINTLVPFESRVLVRYNEESKWCPAVWGFYDYEKGLPHRYVVVGGISFAYCIPYEGNEHLLSKTDDCDNYYKNW